MEKTRHFLAFKWEYSAGAEQLPLPSDCEGCVKWRNAMTAYDYSGEKNTIDDPNRDVLLCDKHWQDYEYYWNDQWSNVSRCYY